MATRPVEPVEQAVPWRKELRNGELDTVLDTVSRVPGRAWRHSSTTVICAGAHCLDCLSLPRYFLSGLGLRIP